MPPNSAWYVLWVMSGRERNLLPRILAINGIEDALVPIQKVWQRKAGIWHEVERVYFPGYVFVRCTPAGSLYYLIRSIPYVINWLSMNGLQPAAVPDAEMEMVQLLDRADPNEIIRKLKLAVDRRKRRARGSVRLMGKDHRISIGLPDDNRQPEARGVDSSPAAAEGEYTEAINCK